MSTTLDYIGTLTHPSDAQLQAAHDEWRANCGPCAVAALLKRSMAEIRFAFPDHRQKGYASPTHMRAALNALGVSHRWEPKATEWALFGFVRIQWCGSWLNPGVHPGAAWAHTHWIAVNDSAVYDCNPNFWVTRADWSAKVAPEIMKYVRGCTGEFTTAGMIHVGPADGGALVGKERR